MFIPRTFSFELIIDCEARDRDRLEEELTDTVRQLLARSYDRAQLLALHSQAMPTPQEDQQ